MEDSDFEDEILLLAASIEDDKKDKRKNIVYNINATREFEGEFHTLHPKLREHEERFYLYYRMTVELFDNLLDMIKDDITKEFTNYRRPILPEERLVITLGYLATGDSYKTIGHSFRVGFSTVGAIIKEVCKAVWKRLQPKYMPEPTIQSWEASVDGYKRLWDFPNCLGSIDGKHVTIKGPADSGSDFYCYLKKFSVVLLAVVDPEYKFIAIDVGAYGKNSDGRIFEESAIGRRVALKEEQLIRQSLDRSLAVKILFPVY